MSLERLAVVETKVDAQGERLERIEDKLDLVLSQKSTGITIPQASIVSLLMSVATGLAGKYLK